MKKTLLWILLAGLVLVMTQAACNFGLRVNSVRGSGNVITEPRQVSNFDGIAVGGGMQLILNQGSEESLELEGEDNILPYIETVIEGTTLVVRYRNDGQINSFRTTRPVIVHASMIHIHSIMLSGGSSGEIGEIDTDRLVLNVSGGGQADIRELQAEELEANLSGGSRASLEGKVETQRLELSGSGNYSARDLESANLRAELSGGGEATVWVSSNLDVTASGGSKLYYFGNPAVRQDLSGGSQIISEGER